MRMRMFCRGFARRQEALLHCGHLLANRNGRTHDHLPARRHPDEARWAMCAFRMDRCVHDHVCVMVPMGLWPHV